MQLMSPQNGYLLWRKRLHENTVDRRSTVFPGFAYYHLGSLWGAVPLRRSYVETGANLNCPRSQVSEVFAFAEENLVAAAAALPESYSDEDICACHAMGC